MVDFNELLKNAIACGDIDFLDKNKFKYNINHRFADEDNDTLLLSALSDKGSNTYSFFLKQRADIMLVNNEGEGVLHAIVFSKDINRLKFFLNNYAVDINHQSNDGATPLLLALSLELYEMANVFIAHNANINIGDNEGITPLHLASQDGNLFMVKLLVEKGANIKTKTRKGNYPLALAVNGDCEEVVRYLYSILYCKN